MQAPDVIPPAVSFSMRLLYPFHLLEGPATQLVAALVAGGKDSFWEVIPPEKDPPGKDYREEYFRETLSFLFSAGSMPPSYCRVRSRWIDKWFRRRLAVVLDGRKESQWRGRAVKSGVGRPPSVPLAVHSGVGIELFIVQGKIGVLSIAFRDPRQSVSLTEIQTLQYHLSHTQYRVPILRIPTQVTDPQLEKFTPDKFSELSLDAPLDQRLGVAGQPFQLLEVCELVLAPARGQIAHPEQRQFLSHLVVQFDRQVEFAQPGTPPAVMQFLWALAQLEEQDHPPAAPGAPGVEWAVLNTRHAAAMTNLAAVHFVANQWEEPESKSRFDAQRVIKMQKKYFTAFLMALAGRLIARRFMQTASDLQREGRSLDQLWRNFTSFEAAGDLIDVSRRASLNRCYQLARRAQRVGEIIGALHRVFRDIQTSDQIARQIDMAAKQGQIAADQRRADARLGLIEIFIVTVYTAELVHILGSTLELQHSYVFAGVLLLGTLAFLTVVHHHHAVHKDSGDSGGSRWNGKLVWLSVITLVAWLTLGAGYFRNVHHPRESAREGNGGKSSSAEGFAAENAKKSGPASQSPSTEGTQGGRSAPVSPPQSGTAPATSAGH